MTTLRGYPNNCPSCSAQLLAPPNGYRQYCIDLGLIARRDSQLQIANRLYRGRTDLFLQWPLTPQGYTDQCGADSAHLLIFDRDPGVDWDVTDLHAINQAASMEVWMHSPNPTQPQP